MRNFQILVIINLLAIAILLIGCGGTDINLPSYPVVKNYYGISVRGKVDETIMQFIENKEEVKPTEDIVSCLHFDLISFRPFKLKYTGQVELKDCNLIGGFAAKDLHTVFNWFDDVYIWSTQYKCYKKVAN